MTNLNFSSKMIDCLVLGELNEARERPWGMENLRHYNSIAARWSVKAVERKVHELCDRGYFVYDVPRGGWVLTDKGRTALAAVRQVKA